MSKKLKNLTPSRHSSGHPSPFHGEGMGVRFDLIMEILFLITVFLVPTIFDRRLGIVFSGTKVAWMRTLAIFMLSLWSLKLLMTKEHTFVRTALDWPVISFLLSTTIATLTSVHVYTSFVGFYGRFEGLSTWYVFGLFFFVATNYLHSFEKFKRVLVMMVPTATIMAIYGIIQRHELDPYQWGGVVTWQRVIGTIGQPNFFAAYMLMAFFLILALMLLEKPAAKEINWFEQLVPVGYFLFCQIAFLVIIYTLEAQDVGLWYLGFAVAAACAVLFVYAYDQLHPLVLNLLLGASLLLIYISLLYTQSRGGYMGFFTGAVLFAAAAGRHLIFANWKKIAVLGALIVMISGVTMLRPEYSPFERFASEITTGKEEVAPGEVETKLELKGAAGSRGETWKSGFRIIADFPFFGIGPEVLKMVFPRYETELFRFKEAFHVKQDRNHNEIFDVGVTKGLMTFFIYGWLIFTLFQTAFKKLKAEDQNQRLLAAGLLGAILAYLIQNQFSFGVVAITSLFWILWAMVVNLGKELPERENVSSKMFKFSWEEVPWLPTAAIVLVTAFLIYTAFISFRADIFLKTGKTFMEMGRFPQAEEELQKSLAVFPFEGITISHLGITQLNLSQQTVGEQAKYLNSAIQTLKYGTEVDAYNADNFYMLARIYFNLSDLPRALDYAQKAIQIDPYYAEVYFLVGLIYERQAKYEEAAEQFKRAFLINPNLTEPMQKLEWAYQKIGKAQEILRVFEEALEKYPDSPFMLERVGKLYRERRKIKEALALFQKLIKVDPKNAMGHVRLGEVYLSQNKVDLAFDSFQQAVLLDPRNAQAHQGLGMAYLQKGNRERAKEEFEQALNLEPGNTSVKRMLEKLK